MKPSDNSAGKERGDAEEVDHICRTNSFRNLAEQYVTECLDKSPKRLPNISGFFRWLKLSATARDHLKKAYPTEYQTIKMIFEDEALNSSLPPSIVSAYMKQYFSDVEEHGDITVVFEHDIKRDGE